MLDGKIRLHRRHYLWICERLFHFEPLCLLKKRRRPLVFNIILEFKSNTEHINSTYAQWTAQCRYICVCFAASKLLKIKKHLLYLMEHDKRPFLLRFARVAISVTKTFRFLASKTLSFVFTIRCWVLQNISHSNRKQILIIFATAIAYGIRWMNGCCHGKKTMNIEIKVSISLNGTSRELRIDY